MSAGDKVHDRTPEERLRKLRDILLDRAEKAVHADAEHRSTDGLAGLAPMVAAAALAHAVVTPDVTTSEIVERVREGLREAFLGPVKKQKPEKPNLRVVKKNDPEPPKRER